MRGILNAIWYSPAVPLVAVFFIWAAFGLLFGRRVSVWFPFLPTRKFYLPVRSPRLQKLLIGESTSYWGRQEPKYLPLWYYRVRPENRGKMSLWGVLFYTGWLLLPALFIADVTWHILPEPVRDLPWLLLIAWPVLTRGLGEQDYGRGFARAYREERQEDSGEEQD